MPDGIYISPTKFVSFAEMGNMSSLKREIASRSAAWDFSGIIGLLPDPDPILQKRGDGVEILESLTGDGHLISAMQGRKLGVMKQEFKFEPGVDEDGKPTSQSEQLCKDFNQDIKKLKSRDLISSILDAPYYGMAPIELTFAPGDGHLQLKKAEAKPVRWFGFNEENELRFRSLDNSEEGEPLPWGKFVVARHFPTYDNPYGLRLLTRCFWPITFKKGGLKFWVTFMEKYGMPFLLGHYQKGTALEEQQAMLSKLEKMVRDAVAVVPEGDKIEMLGGSGKTGGGYMVFDKMKSAMDAEISKVISGQTLTSEAGEKGSYGLGKVHADVLTDFQESDKLLAKETLDEIAGIYGQVNGESVPPPVCTFFEQEDPQSDFAERDKTLEESGRLRLRKSYYIRRYGFQEDDFELVEPDAFPDEQATAKANDEPLDHAEADDPFSADNQAKLADRAQDGLEKKVEEYVREGGDIFGEYKQRIRTWLKEFDTLETTIAALPALFDVLATDGLESALMAALLDSDRLGEDSVPAVREFQEAVWGAGRPFREQLDYFKAKSFSLAGYTQADLIGAIKDELTMAMEEGGDIRDFRKNIDELFIRRGFDPLASHRIETLYRTNMQSAFQAGRYTQLTKPHILKARPYWKYVSVRDGSTRPAHRRMNGKVFHHTHPIWRRWYPPNGFNCRCHVVSLSQREVDRDGVQVTKEDIDGKPFEEINKETGEIKTFLLSPDEGWGGDLGSLERLVNKQQGSADTLEETAQLVEKADLPGPLELGRLAEDDIADNYYQTAEPGRSIDELMATGMSKGEALDNIEAEYRRLLGISPLEQQSVLRPKDGGAVTVTIQALAEALGKNTGSVERLIPFMRQTLETPYEIVLSEYATPSGKTKYRKKYISVFKVDGNSGALAGEVQNDGSIRWQADEDIDRLRTGIKVVHGQG